VVTALRGKQIDAAVEILTPIMGQINSKAVNLLAVTGARRCCPMCPRPRNPASRALWPRPGMRWLHPPRHPPAVIARLNKEINAAVNNPEVAKKLRELNGAGPGQHARADGQAAAVGNQALGRWRSGKNTETVTGPLFSVAAFCLIALIFKTSCRKFAAIVNCARIQSGCGWFPTVLRAGHESRQQPDQALRR
jgi:hypothetical protein